MYKPATVDEWDTLVGSNDPVLWRDVDDGETIAAVLRVEMLSSRAGADGGGGGGGGGGK